MLNYVPWHEKVFNMQKNMIAFHCCHINWGKKMLLEPLTSLFSLISNLGKFSSSFVVCLQIPLNVSIKAHCGIQFESRGENSKGKKTEGFLGGKMPFFFGFLFSKLLWEGLMARSTAAANLALMIDLHWDIQKGEGIFAEKSFRFPWAKWWRKLLTLFRMCEWKRAATQEQVFNPCEYHFLPILLPHSLLEFLGLQKLFQWLNLHLWDWLTSWPTPEDWRDQEYR